MECEAAVVGEQGGEGDQMGRVAVPVLLQRVAGGGGEEGGAAPADAPVVPGGAAAVAVQMAGGVQLAGLAQRERQSDGLECLRRRQTHERAVAPTSSTASSPAEQDALPAPLQGGAPG